MDIEDIYGSLRMGFAEMLRRRVGGVNYYCDILRIFVVIGCGFAVDAAAGCNGFGFCFLNFHEVILVGGLCIFFGG